MFTFHIIVKLRINRHTRAKTLFIREYFTTLSSFSRASKALRPPHFASNFGCFEVADHEN